MPKSLPQLKVPDRVRLIRGNGKGTIGWVSATPDQPYWTRRHSGVAEGHVGVDFEDGIRCILPVEKLEKLS